MVDDYPFGITSDDSVFSEYKVEDGKVVLFKQVCENLTINFLVKCIFFFFPADIVTDFVLV